MIENYVNSVEIIELYIYDGDNHVSATGVPTATATDINTGATVSLSPVQVIDSGDGYNFYQVNVVPSELTYSRTISLNWEYNVAGTDFIRSETINVVRPYFEADTFRQAFPEYSLSAPNSKSYDEIKRVERHVRGIIDEYCQQDFQDLGEKVMRHRGTDTNSLQLNHRIYYLESVTVGEVVLFERDGSGDITTEIVTWNEDEPDILTKKYPTDGFITYRTKDPFIETLYGTREIFKNERLYDVTAKFGWEYLPSNVAEAALLLAKEKFSIDNRYREKNITSLRSADYRMEFGADHHTTTGNVDADILLSAYQKLGLFVF